MNFLDKLTEKVAKPVSLFRRPDKYELGFFYS